MARAPRYLILLAVTCVFAAACGSKAEMIVITGTGENGQMTRVEGTTTYRLDPSTGKLEPYLLKAGTIYLFRRSGSYRDAEATAGDMYRIDAAGKLGKVGVFDLKKTDEELAKQYVRQ